MPDDHNIAWTNTLGMGAIIAVVFTAAFVLDTFAPSLLEIIIACKVFTLVVLAAITYYNKQLVEQSGVRVWLNRAMAGLGATIAAGVLIQLVINAASPATSSTTKAAARTSAPYIGNTPMCLNGISAGHWVETRCDPPASDKSVKSAFCQTSQWIWDADPRCPIGKLSTSKLRSVYHGKKILFAGDSEVRNVYHQFVGLLDPGYQQNMSSEVKHTNIHYQASFDRNMSIDFIWAPMAMNLTSVVHNNMHTGANYQVMAMGATLWDALMGRSVAFYNNELKLLASEISSSGTRRNATTLLWIQTTTITTDRLVTDDKRKYMNEEAIQQYRAAFLASPAAQLFDTVIDGTRASLGKRSKPVDGVHYSDDVYEVVAHMVSNGYTAHFPALSATSPSKKPYVPRTTGSMSFPLLGAMVVGLAAIMLFTMDSFLGIGYLSLVLYGRAYDWDAGYAAMHKKILGTSEDAPVARAGARDAEEGKGDLENDSLLESKTSL